MFELSHIFPSRRELKRENRPTALSMSAFAVVAIFSFATIVVGSVGVRGMLWQTVQVCLLDHYLTGLPLPCLDVRTHDGSTTVVLRAPLDKGHVVVVPGTRIVGIEAHELREAKARNYIEDAWLARAFVYSVTVSRRSQVNIALAINSRQARTQDQLHIHVDCVLPAVKRTLAAEAPRIVVGNWASVWLSDADRPYLVTAIPGNSLRDTNAIELAASGLKVTEDQMPRLSIAVVDLGDPGAKPMFILLAQLARSGVPGDGHAEELLDHDCAARSEITDEGPAAKL